MERFIIEQGDFTLTSTAGLGVVGTILERYTNLKTMDKELNRYQGIYHSDILKSYLGLLCQGKSDFEAIGNFEEDYFFQQSLGIRRLPSIARLRQRMDENSFFYRENIIRANINFLAKVKPVLSTVASGYIPIDIDITLLDNSNSKKEGVCASYKKTRGYMPISAYFGIEGYCLGFDLRPGNQHGQTGTKDLLKKLIIRAHNVAPKRKILFRMDAAHYFRRLVDIFRFTLYRHYQYLQWQGHFRTIP